ncbi:hypothetical protein TMS3_0124690 [Pseudomonas taeanensis MS-3]|uniref:Uncharacterized protein n=1 Tax=Pseudomonas taeanensis MS-3 TaxID=1395571 RepID=A0A0A1YDG4_9PSED|nr:hypothetical protein [Pseudomonas taeanensis]KFX67380.1 hypothetical protein TMS3_0124690 [Pseudomonas taeanensis MS-3]
MTSPIPFANDTSSNPVHRALPFAMRPWLRSRDMDEAVAMLNTQVEECSVQPRQRGAADFHFTLPRLKLFGARWSKELKVGICRDKEKIRTLVL